MATTTPADTRDPAAIDAGPNGGVQLRHIPLSRVPVVTIVIDAPDRIATCFDLVDELTVEHGVVTSEVVRMPAAAPHRPSS